MCDEKIIHRHHRRIEGRFARNGAALLPLEIRVFRNLKGAASDRMPRPDNENFRSGDQKSQKNLQDALAVFVRSA